MFLRRVQSILRKSLRSATIPWHDIARALDLVHERLPEARVHGIIDGHHISIRLISERDLDDEVSMVFAHVALVRSLPVSLWIRSLATTGDADRLRFTEDVTFDSEVAVSSPDPDFLREWLTPLHRQSILELLRMVPRCELDQSGILWTTPASSSSTATLVAAVQGMLHAARALTRNA